MDLSRLVSHVAFHLKLCLSLIFQIAYIDFSRRNGACQCFCFVFVSRRPFADWGDVH